MNKEPTSTCALQLVYENFITHSDVPMPGDNTGHIILSCDPKRRQIFRLGVVFLGR